MNPRGTVTAFYSYKGGTGRTMALANAAVLLAREGAGDVLMIDWDLEAPGLHRFFPEVEAEATGTPGVLELFEHAWGESEDEKLDADAFWQELGLHRIPTKTEERALHMIMAGDLGETYGSRVNHFDWRRLFDRWPELFLSFADHLASRYSHVLIDSRTGLSDSSGICTTLMPDQLVTVFTPNRQSLDGVIELSERATAYRGNSEDVRPLLVFPLASRVEMSEEELRQEWRYGGDSLVGYQPRFESLFKGAYDLPRCDLESYFDEIQVQHATSYAYGERVAVRDDHSDRLSLGRSYERFARVLLNGQTPWRFESELRPEASEEARERILARADETLRRHRRAAWRYHRFDLVVLGVATALVLASLVLGIVSLTGGTQYYLPFSGFLLLVAASSELLRRIGVRPRYVIHTRAANRLNRSIGLFESSAGPFTGTEGQITVLAEEIAEIEAEAEEALLEPVPVDRRRPPTRSD